MEKWTVTVKCIFSGVDYDVINEDLYLSPPRSLRIHFGWYEL